MNDVVYPYDRTLYSRLFMNCYQRQSMVMLAERTPSLHEVFHTCLVSTDRMLDQVVRRQLPKYDFSSRFFAFEDFEKIGFVRYETPVDSWDEVRPLLLDVLRRQGYVILVIDVFYFPHCPEYRREHLGHTITLRDYDAESGEWSLIDDNPASTLCEYRYPESMIAAGYDNCFMRRFRHFEPRDPEEFDAESGRAATTQAFTGLIAEHQDSYELLLDVDACLDSRWTAPEKAIAALYDVFSIYQGSRMLFHEYVRHEVKGPEVESAVSSAVRQAARIQEHLLLAKVTGGTDLDWMTAACRELKSIDEEVVHRLQDV